MSSPNHRVSVVFMCRKGDEHRLCVPVSRGVPPELRCSPGAPQGYGNGGGVGCSVPVDLSILVERELRYSLEESKRRRFVLIRE